MCPRSNRNIASAVLLAATLVVDVSTATRGACVRRERQALGRLDARSTVAAVRGLQRIDMNADGRRIPPCRIAAL
jgi:hypothetical protein